MAMDKFFEGLSSWYENINPQTKKDFDELFDKDYFSYIPSRIMSKEEFNQMFPSEPSKFKKEKREKNNDL